MSKIYVDEIAPKTSGNKVLMPQGGIIQVQYTQFTGTNSVSLTADTGASLSDLTVNITPISTSSVIHLQAHIFCEFGNDTSGSVWDHVFFFYRDTTKLGHPSAGNRNVGVSMATRTVTSSDNDSTPEIARYDYFDTPASTAQITYKCGVQSDYTDTLYINKTVGDQDFTNRERGISFISATEIAG
jgi:hypothetical protein